jgi:integrase
LDKTKFRAKEFDQVFLTLSKPFRPAKPNTLAKHLKEVLRLAGIKEGVFTAHSLRAASTSQALANGLPIDQILKRATWASENTFARFYAKDIQEGQAFSQAVLSK